MARGLIMARGALVLLATAAPSAFGFSATAPLALRRHAAISQVGSRLSPLAAATRDKPTLMQSGGTSIHAHLSDASLSASSPSTCIDASLSATTRRHFLSKTASLTVILAPSLAAADSTGKFSSKRTAKNRYVPRIKKGMAALTTLEAGGDAAPFAATLEDMVSAMKLYGQANKRGETPDKISIRLESDSEAFLKAGKSGDTASTRQALDKYFEDLPKDGKAPFGTGLIQKIE